VEVAGQEPVNNDQLVMQMLLSIKEDSKSLREDNEAMKQRMDKLETAPTSSGSKTLDSTASTTAPSRKRKQPTNTPLEDALTTMAAPSEQLLEPEFDMDEEHCEQEAEHQQSWMPQQPSLRQLPQKGVSQVSGRHRTADSSAKHPALWPQERVHDARGQIMKYEALTWDKFVLGYLCVTQEADPKLQPLLYLHLRDMMEDAGIYGLEAVKAFHGVWLNHIEQGRATWQDEHTREKLRRQFVWNAPQAAPKTAPAHHNTTSATATFSTQAAPHSSNRSQRRRRPYAPVLPAGPRTNPCKSFNLGTCTEVTSHPQADHVCSYCCRAQSRLCYHTEKDCGYKTRAE
jgi:hypothetical protein